ncbi:thyroid adenoma-associated protein homolog isoform X2 [Erpetoichthys calabaricus]|uniref:thyroid adenoma-associated protein homolog isoform X2 n=1 Tax=Erpetoichthys calabaricus TaxID=27687 RepID=UPI0022344B56|nr:thyroid adenoma-associated protein homolog isoform X2 [Erpetoichthys calabaricus]
MVLKKKKKEEVKAGSFALEDGTLEKLQDIEGGPVGKEIMAILQECAQKRDGIFQIQLIKKIGPLFRKLQGNVMEAEANTPLLHDLLQILIALYFSVDSKNPQKKALMSALLSIPDALQPIAVGFMVQCLKEQLQSESPAFYRSVTDAIAACTENSFNLGHMCIQVMRLEVFQFLQKALSQYQFQNRALRGNHIAQAHLMQDCLAAVKTAMVVTQKQQEPIHEILHSQANSPLWEVMSGLLQSFSEMLCDDDFLQTVQSTAGMAVILFMKTMLKNKENLAELVGKLLNGTWSEESYIPLRLSSSCAQLFELDRSETVALFLCHGALAMLDWKDKVHGSNGEKLLLQIPSTLITLDSRHQESSMAMSLSRILSMWTSVTLDVLECCSQAFKDTLKGSSPLAVSLLEYVYSHWDHPLDGIRHQTKTIFRNILRIHRTATGKQDPNTDPFFISLTQNLLSLEWHIKGKYASLSCLVEFIGPGSLLAAASDIPAQLLAQIGDQSLAPYASDLLETMFVSHKTQLRSSQAAWLELWHKTWVEPLMSVLCEGHLDQTSYIIDYCLPRILKCSPESLAHMIELLQNSGNNKTGSKSERGTLGALMTCLRAARAHGVLEISEDSCWSELLPITLLRQALVNKHDQVRLDTLGFLCESHRSTEVLTSTEMDLIRLFLPNNLNSQAPAIRQQIVCLMKKLFSRIRDSAQPLQKRVDQNLNKPEVTECLPETETLKKYKEFLIWVCGSLFHALFPGASFPTCFCALHLLNLLADTFTFLPGGLFELSEFLMHEHVEVVLECLAHSFEEIKILSFGLLMKFPASSLDLKDDSRVKDLFKAALALSSSTKPFDCVTASYLLRLLVHHYELQSALDGKVDIKSDGSVLELNTLCVVKLLLLDLTSEVVQAETSLLQAAATQPLYGRVHCIVALLQQLETKSLTLISEWRALSTDLITVSYKMSAVVSPVVQSSSPEGLIPMDTDSEIASSLQDILREIQPRDSNNFFSGARLLGEEQEVESSHLKIKEGRSPSLQVTAQMVLVCCWRSMKEVSILLGILCQQLPLQVSSERADGLLTVQQVEEIGQYFRQQLLQSRHRGAFELAYVGFVKLTDMLSRCQVESLRKLPEQWLQDILEEVTCSGPSSKLCATRRSAGIPFYVQALLSSEPKSSTCFLLKTAMKQLIALALPTNAAQNDYSAVPQVHAMNILRALFRDTRLGENIVPYIVDGMKAAILGFTSPVWAVRNSATLLFSAVMTRMFGVKKGKDESSKKNRMTGREFFSRYPALYPFLLNCLEAASEENQRLHPNLFLLLLILGRLYPSPMDGSYSTLSLAPFVPLIIRCRRSPVYRSREMAARALVPFVTGSQAPLILQQLLQDLPDHPGTAVPQNYLHGTLLQILYLLRSHLESRQRTDLENLQVIGDLASQIHSKFWLASRVNPCYVTRACFLDIVTCLNKAYRASASEELKELLQATVSDSELLDHSSCSVEAPGWTQYLISITSVALSVNPQTQLNTLFHHLLKNKVYEVRALVLDALVKWMQGLDGTTENSSLSRVKSILRNMALQELHPICLGKVLRILSCLNMDSLLPWTTESGTMSFGDLLKWAVSLTESSIYSEELFCDALFFTSKLILYLVQCDCKCSLDFTIQHFQDLSDSMLPDVQRWVTLMAQCCEEAQSCDVKMTAADILVRGTTSILSNVKLTLGLQETLTLWRILFTLLQDEDQDVRECAADFIGQVPSELASEILTDIVHPVMALDKGLSLLCQLFKLWDQTSSGVIVLTEWLLRDASPKENTEEDCSLVDEEYLFEKGEVNMWAEKLVYIRMLFKHLSKLLASAQPVLFEEEEVSQLLKLASSRERSVKQLLKQMPPFPKFSKTYDFNQVHIEEERIASALTILNSLQKKPAVVLSC